MTAQVYEKLIYEGEEMPMASCPPLPKDARIKMLGDDELDMENIDGIVFSTACWRQYVGTWEIKDGKLYLVDVVGRYQIVGDSPIFADWFSGVIRIPRGEMLQYVHMGFASVYEEDLLVKIEKGVVVETNVIDNRGKEVDPFELAKKHMPRFEDFR